MIILAGAIIAILLLWIVVVWPQADCKSTIKETARAPLTVANPQTFTAPIIKEIPFQQWAFGSGGYNEPNLWKAWNSLHGATYPLYPNDIGQVDLDMMQSLYKQAIKKSKPVDNVLPVNQGGIRGETPVSDVFKQDVSVQPVDVIKENTLQTNKRVTMKKKDDAAAPFKAAGKAIKDKLPSKVEVVMKAAHKEPEKMKRAPKIGIKSKKMKGK